MNGRRRFAVLSVLLGTLLLSFILASAASASPVSQKKARLQQIQGKLQAVYHQVDVAVERYNQATTQLSGVQQQIKQNAHLLKVAEYNLQVADEQLQSRALDIYKTRDVGIVDVLFSSSRSFDDLVTQLNMMQRLGNGNVDTVKSIAAYRQDIKNRRVKLEADKKSAARLVADRASQGSQLTRLQHKLESG